MRGEAKILVVDLDSVALPGHEVGAKFDDGLDDAIEGVTGDTGVVGRNVGDADDQGVAVPAVRLGPVELVAAGGQA